MVWKRYSVNASAPDSNLNLLSWTFTINAFFRRQIEQSHIVSSGKSLSISNLTAPQWHRPETVRIALFFTDTTRR